MKLVKRIRYESRLTWKFVLLAWRDIKWVGKQIYQQHKLLDLVFNHVPKYGRRTDVQNEKIRRRIKIDPAECSHMKGQSFQRPGFIQHVADFALLSHRMIDGSVKVWCMYCKQHFDFNDPKTKNMLKQSSNKMSTSEAPMLSREQRVEALKRKIEKTVI